MDIVMPYWNGKIYLSTLAIQIILLSQFYGFVDMFTSSTNSWFSFLDSIAHHEYEGKQGN